MSRQHDNDDIDKENLRENGRTCRSCVLGFDIKGGGGAPAQTRYYPALLQALLQALKRVRATYERLGIKLLFDYGSGPWRPLAEAPRADQPIWS